MRRKIETENTKKSIQMSFNALDNGLPARRSFSFYSCVLRFLNLWGKRMNRKGDGQAGTQTGGLAGRHIFCSCVYLVVLRFESIREGTSSPCRKKVTD